MFGFIRRTFSYVWKTTKEAFTRIAYDLAWAGDWIMKITNAMYNGVSSFIIFLQGLTYVPNIPSIVNLVLAISWILGSAILLVRCVGWILSMLSPIEP